MADQRQRGRPRTVQNWTQSNQNYDAIIAIINGITGVTDLTYPESISTLLVQQGGSAGTVPLTMLNQLCVIVGGVGTYTTNKTAVNAIAVQLSGLGGWSNEVDAWTEIALLTFPMKHYWVNEATARIASRNTAYAGTVRNVGAGQTYATITEAFAACVNGDIIQINDGTYNIASEAGGYLILNRSNIGVLVRGNAADSSAVTLSLTTSAANCVKLRLTGEMRFENITFTSNQNLPTFIKDGTYASLYCKFYKCNFVNTSDGSSSSCYRKSGDALAGGFTEFEDCNFTKSGGGKVCEHYVASTTCTFLYKNCTYNLSDGVNFEYQDSCLGTIAIYDSYVVQNGDYTAIKIGSDTTAPIGVVGVIDIRSCTINYAEGKGGHGLLLGRGTSKVYCVNNIIQMGSSANIAALAIGLKTTAAIIGDAVIAGNICIAPRPFIIKGASKTLAKWNTFICNYTDNYGALEVNNPVNVDGEKLSTLNQITDCNIFGQIAAIRTYTASASEAEQVTMQGWTVDRNNYYTKVGNWAQANVASPVNHAFATKNSFWDVATTNDNNSKLVIRNDYIISEIKKDV